MRRELAEAHTELARSQMFIAFGRWERGETDTVN
jgi:hypothetical protein